jgi:hypothetical protein
MDVDRESHPHVHHYCDELGEQHHTNQRSHRARERTPSRVRLIDTENGQAKVDKPERHKRLDHQVSRQ